MIMSKLIKMVSDFLFERKRSWCVVDVCIIMFAIFAHNDYAAIAVLLAWAFFADDAIDSLRNYINEKVGDREAAVID